MQRINKITGDSHLHLKLISIAIVSGLFVYGVKKFDDKFSKKREPKKVYTGAYISDNLSSNNSYSRTRK